MDKEFGEYLDNALENRLEEAVSSSLRSGTLCVIETWKQA
jgi:hypothetical protein